MGELRAAGRPLYVTLSDDVRDRVAALAAATAGGMSLSAAGRMLICEALAARDSNLGRPAVNTG